MYQSERDTFTEGSWLIRFLLHLYTKENRRVLMEYKQPCEVGWAEQSGWFQTIQEAHWWVGVAGKSSQSKAHTPMTAPRGR